jgi:hypothetical protein
MLATYGYGSSALGTWGWGGGGVYVPPIPPAPGTGLIPTLDDVLLLRPTLQTELEGRPGAPDSLALIPSFQALWSVLERLVSALLLLPGVSTEGPEEPATSAKSLVPRIDTEPPGTIDLAAEALEPSSETETDEDPAVSSRNLRPKLKR